MGNLEPQFYKSCASGMITNVNKNLLPPDSVALGLNVDFDQEIGSPVTRLGSALLCPQIVNNNSILGLHNHIDPSNSNNNQLFAAVNDDTTTTGTFTVNDATDVITSNAHNLRNGNIVRVSSTGTLPPELSAGVDYYVINRTVNTFQLSSTFSGGAINFSTAGTGTHTWQRYGVTIYDVSTGTSSSSTSGFKQGYPVRFLTFLGQTLAINGIDAERSYDNSSGWVTTGGAFDLANMPGSNTCTISIEWLDRVYLAGDTNEPSRLYYSSTPTSGAISWTSGNGFLDVEPEDGGGSITGLGKVPGYLLIFKERTLKRWNFDSAFPETLIQIGTPIQESIINAGGLCAFFSSSSREARGFYVTNGDRPVPISHDRIRNIKKWIDAIPQANEVNIAGWGDARSFYWSIGDVTVDGRTFSNVVVRWNRILDQWSIHTYPTQITRFASFVDRRDLNDIKTITVAGDDDGNVIELGKPSVYTDYNDQPIYYEIRFQEEDFNFNQKKELTEHIVIQSKNMPGARVTIDHDGVKYAAGEVRTPVTEIPIKQISANIIQIGITGTVAGARASLSEVELPNITVTQNY